MTTNARKVVNILLTVFLLAISATMGLISWIEATKFEEYGIATAIAGIAGALFVLACVIWSWKK